MIVYDIRDLVKVYPGQPKPANKNITLQIQPGEVFGLLGDNGAGKSTLVRQMVNLTRSTSGSITLLGQDIRRDAASVTTNVGYMPQEGLALNNLTVGEALYFTAHLRGLSRADALRERDRLAEAMQLAALRGQVVPKALGRAKAIAADRNCAGGPPAGVDPGRADEQP